ncbi:superoxide dismutase family protein [Candidatus Marinamargulisbacteria bacterium SCGC AG-439-L15]|nr:superoxide dismutase family protein [Candidatus Marinamargulisbacteria bacterium SCGC AG-439-L15]
MRKQLISTFLIFSILALSLPIEASSHKKYRHQKNYRKHKVEEAVAIIQPTRGNSVKGVVIFRQKKEGVKVTGRFTGLTPNQKHGIHIHQYGDISSPDGKSAGGHYNPKGHPHGHPPTLKRHAGSFGNIQADKKGRGSIDLFDKTISISRHHHPILGRTVVIHAKEDTGEQPAGNAGSRIGIGVIGIKKP